VSRELTPDDKPETIADKKLYNQLFGDDISGVTVPYEMKKHIQLIGLKLQLVSQLQVLLLLQTARLLCQTLETTRQCRRSYLVQPTGKVCWQA